MTVAEREEPPGRRQHIPIPSRVPISLKYGAEALAMVGIAYGLIKWVGRNLRSLISDSGVESARIEALAASTPAAAADSLVRQGIVSAEDMARMTPREREFLVAAAGRQLHQRADQNRPRQATPKSSEATGAPSSARSPSAAPRLHLITPSRPPLGMSVHCPGCGVAVDREALQRFGTTACPRCKRPISAHIQRGRLTVIVEETPEEAEHRKRLDGGQ